jgi:hypothetical protein
MPRGDRTGPNFEGPMTGRRAGYCAGYDAPGYMTPGFGRGAGRGFRRGAGRGYGRPLGMGRGMRWAGPPVWDAPPTRSEESEMLKDEAEYLERELNAVKERLDTLSAEDSE